MKRKIWKEFGFDGIYLLEKAVLALKEIKEKLIDKKTEGNKFTIKVAKQIIRTALECDEGFADDVFEKIIKLGWISIEKELDGKAKLCITEEGMRILEEISIEDLLTSPNVLDEVNKILGELIAGEETNRQLLFLIGLSAYLEESKFLTLLFNSVVGLSQLLILAKETTESYREFMQSDLVNMVVLNYDRPSPNEKKIFNGPYNKIKDVALPSLLEQFENRFWARVELDRIILKVLGFPIKK